MNTTDSDAKTPSIPALSLDINTTTPTSQQQHQQQPSRPAYLLEWADYDPITTRPQTVHRTPLPTADALRDALAQPRGSPTEPDHHFLPNNPPRYYERRDGEQDDEQNLHRRLIIFPGPQPRELLDAVTASVPSPSPSVSLSSSSSPSPPSSTTTTAAAAAPSTEGAEEATNTGINVDPHFVACLAARRPYRPARLLEARAWKRRTWASSARVRAESFCFVPGGYVWVYPEVVELAAHVAFGSDYGSGSWSGSKEVGGLRVGPGMGGGIHGKDRGGAAPIVMVLSSEGEGEEPKFGVVFCQAGLWMGKEGSVLFLDRPVWEGAETGMRKNGDTAASFEDVLLEALQESWEPEDQLPGIVAEAVRHRWLELFDHLETPSQTMGATATACYLQMMRSLELNCEGEDDVAWRRLLGRLQRRIDLFSALRDKTSISLPATSRTSKTPDTQGKRANSQTREIRNSVSRRARDGNKPVDEHQRALDRLSLLGGILIPLPIISGILSMGDVYGPDGNKFFVFWASALPLAMLTVLLIHADTVRKGEVWVPISSDRIVPAPEDKSGSSGGDGSGSVDVGKGQRPVSRRRNQAAMDHSVEERIIGMPAVATVQLEDDGALNARWSMGREEVPAMILEFSADGSKPKAWKRKQMGWTGAVKQTLFNTRFRAGHDVPDGVAACEEPRRKTA